MKNNINIILAQAQRRNIKTIYINKNNNITLLNKKDIEILKYKGSLLYEFKNNNNESFIIINL